MMSVPYGCIISTQMNEFSTTAVSLIAFSKAIFFVYCAGTVYLLWRRAGAVAHMLLTTAAVVLFYAVFAWPLTTMWWGNSGDENLILAFLTQVLHGNMFRDFYHAWLPPYYPPLYFWITGSVARLFTANAVQAAKLGTVFALTLWFAAPLALWSLFNRSNMSKQTDETMRLPWFWFFAPFIFFLMIDFDAVITKPYEVLSALLVALFTGLLAQALSYERWTIAHFLFFGITGGILFMTFYFWLFIALVSLLAVAVFSKQRTRAVTRIISIGIIMVVVSSPYLVPLLMSYARYGIENWQGHFFVPGDLATIIPWGMSLRGLLAAAGLTSLVVTSGRSFFARGVLALFVASYVYQLAGITSLLLGMTPFVPSKPFPFLSSACLAVGIAYGACFLGERYAHRLSRAAQRSVAILVFLVLVSEMPFVTFLDNPKVLVQLQQNLDYTADAPLAGVIASFVPDYRERTWLVSDVPRVSSVLPLSYFISFNQHYSHHASQFSRRFDLVRRLSTAQTPAEFNAIIAEGEPPIDALALYRAHGSSEYLLFFWVDHYPNGGSELTISIPRHLLESSEWLNVYELEEWSVFIASG